MKKIFVLILAAAINAVFKPYENRSNRYFFRKKNNLGSYPNNQQIDRDGNHNNYDNQSLFYRFDDVDNPLFKPPSLKLIPPELSRCPPNWVEFDYSCYRPIRSFRNKNSAELTCEALKSDLVSVNTFAEQWFVAYHLLGIDRKQKWYTSIRQRTLGMWINDGDGTKAFNMENKFPTSDEDSNRTIVVFSFSQEIKRWGYEAVSGLDPLFYVCEAPVRLGSVDDRNFSYGLGVVPDIVPMGPFFTIEPTDVVFDLSKSNDSTVVELRCSAGGHPSPSYMWYKEQLMYNLSLILPIDPYQNKGITMNGGSLMIHKPQDTDRGLYHCRASNQFGSIRSENVSLSFGFIGEFSSSRKPEPADAKRGLALYCYPPKYHPAINYFWSRNSFANAVKENQRVFSSSDGTLFFSYLLENDEGLYSCGIKNQFSEIVRRGPLFPLLVNPEFDYQKLIIPSGFPKVFPTVPQAGKDIRLECVAFGDPPLYYKWLRPDAPLPKLARTENYDRVLIIPQATVQDGGRYVCQVNNDQSLTSKCVMVSIHVKPYFTIPLANKHMDEHSDLSWACEAFGIPNVNFTWFRNGNLFNQATLPPEFRHRYNIQDNVIKIKDLDPEKDPAMFQCIAQNDIGTTLSSAQLRVIPLPIYDWWQLPEKFIPEEGNITFSCNPENAPRHNVVWTKRGEVIVTGGKMRIFANGSLSISSVAQNDSGLYNCTAVYFGRKEISSERLIVLRVLKWVKPLPPKIVVIAQKNFTMECEGSFDESLFTEYLWKRNGKRLIDSKRIVINEGLIHFTRIRPSDSGVYACIMESDFHRITSKTRLKVHGKPGPPTAVVVQSTKPTSATIQWKDGAENGRPIFQYSITAQIHGTSAWVHIANLTNVRTAGKFSERKEVILSNNTLSPWTTYHFRVAAFNKFGCSKPSKPSLPSTTQSAKPYKFPAKIGGGGGYVGNLTITWNLLPPQDHNAPGIRYKVFWRRRYSLNIDTKSKYLGEDCNEGIAIIPIGTEFYYTRYAVRVQAINDVGEGPVSPSRYIMSAEDTPIVTPQNLSFTRVNATAIFVTWDAVPKKKHLIRGKLIGYRLKSWDFNDLEENATYTHSVETNTWALIVNLKPDSYYFIKATAFNRAGHGPEGKKYIAFTAPRSKWSWHILHSFLEEA